MDMFILIGAGFLGAAFLASQSQKPMSTLWKLIYGGSGGACAWLILMWLEKVPQDPSLSGFIMLFVIGVLAGAVVMLLGIFFWKRR